MRDLNKVCKSILFVAKQGKNGKNYYCRLTLINDVSTDIFCEKELYDAMKVLKEINGKAISKQGLVEEISEKTNEPYTCVLIELVDGSTYRFFPKKAFDSIVKALYGKYEQENLKK